MKTNVKHLNEMNAMNAKLTDLTEQELRDINGGTIYYTIFTKDGKIYIKIETRSEKKTT